MRKNPLMWDDEAPQGVLSPFEGGEAGIMERLTGGPAGNTLLRVRDLDAAAQAGPEVLALFDAVAAALTAAAKDGKGWRRRIDGLAADQRAVFRDALGEGEVAVMLSGGAPEEGDAQIQETALPGVWLGQAADEDGVVRAEWVEVADAPRALREAAELRPRDDIPLEALVPPREAMNVMAVLAEVRERARDWRPGVANHVINFTLFPMTEADSAFLAKVLGEAGVRASSGGYGAARVVMTGLKRVWAVQFLNAMGTVILDTLEIGDAPGALLASVEDFEDSAARMREIMEAYAP